MLRTTAAIAMMSLCCVLSAADEKPDYVVRYTKFAAQHHKVALAEAKVVLAEAEARDKAARTGAVQGVTSAVTNGTAALSAIDAGLIKSTSADPNKPDDGSGNEPTRVPMEVMVFSDAAGKNLAVREAAAALLKARAAHDLLVKGPQVPTFSPNADDLIDGAFGRFRMQPYVPEDFDTLGVEVAPALHVIAVTSPEEMAVRYVRTIQLEGAPSPRPTRPFVIQGLSTENLRLGDAFLCEDAFEVHGTGEYIEGVDKKMQAPLLIRRDLAAYIQTPEPAAPPADPAAADAETPEWVARFQDFVGTSYAQELAGAQFDLEAAIVKLKEVTSGRLILPPPPGTKRPKGYKAPKPPPGTVVFRSLEDKSKATAEANAVVKAARTRVEELLRGPVAPVLFDGAPPDGLFCRLEMGVESTVENTDRVNTVRQFHVDKLTAAGEVIGTFTSKVTRVRGTNRTVSDHTHGGPVCLQGVNAGAVKPDAYVVINGTFEVVGRKLLIAEDGSKRTLPLLIRRDVDKYLKPVKAAKPGADKPADADAKPDAPADPTLPADNPAPPAPTP